MANSIVRDFARCDVQVGSRIRSQRVACGWSEAELAVKSGVASARLSEIQSGAARASAGELYDLAKALGTTISYFFKGLER